MAVNQKLHLVVKPEVARQQGIDDGRDGERLLRGPSPEAIFSFIGKIGDQESIARAGQPIHPGAGRDSQGKGPVLGAF